MSHHDYQRIEQAIRFVTQQQRRQPSLAEIAQHVGLSPAYLQRLFTRWAGVSPKQFLQYLTVEYARELLAESRSVLDATYEVGLSSPGRLHDHFVTVMGVTPGEYKSIGRKLQIGYGFCDSPFGECLLATTPRGICWLAFVEQDGRAAVAELRRAWPLSEIQEVDAAAEVARGVFDADSRADRPLSVMLKGTNFQLQVWQALLRIPVGALATYGDLARAIEHPQAARAVGTAVGSNPIAWLIPCHRVLREQGIAGEYRWGPIRKQAMIGWEAAQRAIPGAVAGAPPDAGRT